MSCQRAMSPWNLLPQPSPLLAHLYSYFPSSSDPAPAPPPPILLLLLLQCWQAGRLLIGQQQKPVPTRDESSKVGILFSVKCPKKFFLKYLFKIKWLDLFIFGIILLLHGLCTVAHPWLAWRVVGGWPQCKLAPLSGGCTDSGVYTWSPSNPVQQYTSLLGAQVIPSNRSCTHVPGTQWTKQTNIDACLKTKMA